MYQFDPVLKMYAESGLRTAEDWTSLGRDLVGGSKPRVDTPHRGTIIPLFSRDQTQQRPPSSRAAKSGHALP
jgi:hypothetical protein